MKLKILIATLLLSIGTAWAQQQDSTSTKHFNALDYLLQDRYSPERRIMNPKDWRANTSMSMYGGFSHLILGSPSSRESIDFGLSYTRDWSALHSVRIAGSFQLANRKTNRGIGTQRRYGLEIDDEFHFLDFLWGYRPGRHFDVHTVLGLGIYASDPEHGKTRFSAGVHAGLHLSRLLYKRIGIFVEPRVHLYTDGFDAVTDIESSRKYHTGIQILAGSTYFFKDKPIRRITTDDLFYEIYVGAHGDYSDRADTWFDGKSGRMGPTYGIGVGKWYLPLGFRVSLFGGNQDMPNEKNDDETLHYLHGMRVEGMVNFNNLICPHVTSPWLEINGGFGYELAALGRDREYMLKDPFTFAHGLTTSAQLLVRLNERYGIFLQGRYSNLKYKEKFTNDTKQEREKQNFGFELGMQYRNNRKEALKYNKSFRAYNFITASMGLNASLISKNSTTLNSLLDFGHVRPQFTLGIGRRLSPYSTVRGIIEMGKMGIGKHDKAHPLTIGADYMLDLSTLITHYNKERLFTLSQLVGILYTHHERGTSKKDTRITDCDGNFLGFRFGLNEHFRVNERWGIFVEENIRVYKEKINPKAPTFTHRNLSLLPEMNIGVNYNF